MFFNRFMLKLANFKVATRLGVGFALVLALLLAMALSASFLIKHVHENGRYYFDNVVPSLDNVAQVRGDMENIRRAEANHILSNSEQDMAALEQRIARDREHLRSTLAAYEKLVSDDEDKLY